MRMRYYDNQLLSQVIVALYHDDLHVLWSEVDTQICEKLAFDGNKEGGFGSGTTHLSRTHGHRKTCDDEKADHQAKLRANDIHFESHWIRALAQPLNDREGECCSVPT